MRNRITEEQYSHFQGIDPGFSESARCTNASAFVQETGKPAIGPASELGLPQTI
jgi:hypothetical protein